MFSKFNVKCNNKEQLLTAINNQFSIVNERAEFHRLFPFSNDSGYAEIIKILIKCESRITQKLTVSLVFGESNFISLLPVLSNFSNILLLADVNPDLHQHTQFLLDCFTASSNPSEFVSNYSKNNPAVGKIMPTDSFWNNIFSRSILIDNLNYTKGSVGKYHFLRNQANFDKCKNALNKISLLPIHFNIADNQSCKNLNVILKQYNAELTFCNFTNIPEYNERMDYSVKLLLNGHEDALIMLSSRDRKKQSMPRSILALGLDDYLSIDKEKDYSHFDVYIKHVQHLNESINNSIINKSFFINNSSIQINHKSYGVCYAAVSCSKDNMKNIIDGKLDINSLSSLNAHAHDTEDELKKFISDRKNEYQTKGYPCEFIADDNYWIVTFNNSKQKINPFLHRSSNQEYRIDDHMKISPYIMKAVKLDGSMTIEKPAEKIPDKYKINTHDNLSACHSEQAEPAPNVAPSQIKLAIVDPLSKTTDDDNRVVTSSVPLPVSNSSNTKGLVKSRVAFFNTGCDQGEPKKTVQNDHGLSHAGLIKHRI